MNIPSLADAVLMLEAGRFDEALEPLQVLVKTNPKLETHYALAHALEMLQRWPEAQQAWVEVVRKAEAESPLSRLERLVQDMGGRGPAQESSQTALFEEDDPEPDPTLEDTEVVTETWARVLETQGLYAEAKKVYLQLAEVHPEQVAYFEDRAQHMALLLREST